MYPCNKYAKFSYKNHIGLIFCSDLQWIAIFRTQIELKLATFQKKLSLRGSPCELLHTTRPSCERPHVPFEGRWVTLKRAMIPPRWVRRLIPVPRELHSNHSLLHKCNSGYLCSTSNPSRVGSGLEFQVPHHAVKYAYWGVTVQALANLWSKGNNGLIIQRSFVITIAGRPKLTQASSGHDMTWDEIECIVVMK